MSRASVTASYPLAALQGAMLVNHLRAPRSGVDILQVVSTLAEDVDVAAMRAAWERATARHGVLRTTFRWEGVAEPMQEVHDRAPTPVSVEDWSREDPSTDSARWAAFLDDDRRRGFDLRELPLQRVTLIRAADGSWRMVWTLHHILMDGRSFTLVLREVFAAYDAARRGATVAATPAPPAYADFADWYTAQDFSRAEPAWRERLRGVHGPTPIPAAFLSGEETSGRGLLERSVDAGATASLEALAAAAGVTMSTVCQGAWALLLSRHSGEDDVVFGATRACRRGTIAHADEMIGLFINTLPVRARVRDDAPIAALLGELRATWRSMFEIEHTPTQLVHRWSGVDPTSPVFETHVVFETRPLEATMRAEGAHMAGRRFHWYGGTNFPLTMLIYGGERLSLEIDYERSRIDDATARRVLDQYATLLANIAANPNARLGDLSMVPGAERALVSETWNSTAVSYPSATLVELMARQVARTPDAIAVEDERTSLTFARLDAAATALARRLRGHGVDPNVLVGICAERSVELVVGLVAILKAGGAYVPLDPEYPRDRLEFMLEDSGVAVLLAQTAVIKDLALGATTVISLDGVAAAADNGAALPLPSPDDAAYMIYTSGSTGRPKGALNAHSGIVNRVLWMDGEYHLTPADVVLQKTPFSFDVSVWEFFWPLTTGATLVMARPGGHRDTAYLADVVSRRGVTVCHFVPSMLRAFLSDPSAAKCVTLRDVMASGEALAPDLVATFNRTLPRAQLHNLYGPTECAVDVTYWPCPRGAEPPRVVPIGRPVANTRMYVLDGRGAPSAIGVAGELFIGGVQVGLGYHKRPELTAERFVADPFSADTAARLYKTGDKARWRPDGTIEYLGRLDFQVKLRGFRIELGEIEAALLTHPDIADTVVVARADGSAEQRLVAYMVARAGAATPSVSALREHLMVTLPDYMVPAAFMWLPALPLGTSGKVDRRALPAPELERETLSRSFVAPRTPAEKTLAEIWAQVLRLEKVGVDDNFFELGGDSLLSVQIVSRAASAGLRISLMQVMRHPTVAALAHAAEAATPAAVLDQGDVIGAVPLTPIQQWFFENQNEETHHWNQAFLFTAPADLDAAALAGAASAVTRHHDSLRLRFERGPGGWRQTCVADAVQSSIEELRVSTEDERHAAFARIQGSLDIETGPLMRLGLVRREDGRQSLLLIAVHHLAVDGVSWQILREDLETAYLQRRRGETIALARRSTPFGRWATQLAAPAAADSMRDELEYWERAGSAASVRVPRDLAGGGDDRAANTDTVVVSLDESETRALLQQVPKAYNTQINDALLAALGDALTGWLGGGEIVVNVEGHGREDVVDGAHLSRTLGWFTTLFPVRLRLGASDVAGRLKETKELLRSIPRRGIGYGILRYLARAETLRAQTTPEIVFNYMGQFDQVVAGSTMFGFAPQATGPWYGARTRRPHLFEINCLVIDNRLEVRWSYSPRAHTRETVARVAAAYVSALRSTISHCTADGVGGYTPSDFPVAALDQATLDRVTGTRRDVDDLYPVVPMQRLFLGFADPASDPGFEQWRYRLRGPVNLEALRAAWELVVSRHSVLRTAFVSDGLENPLQIVARAVALPWTEHDWRGVPHAEQERRLNELLAADRAAGFSFDRAPLMRVAVVRLMDERYELVWSKHHLLLDRWSWPLVLLDVARAYPAIARGVDPAMDPAPRYGDFVAWQQRQPLEASREFWSRHFAGFEAPPRLPVLHPEAGDAADEESVALTPVETDAVNSFARTNQIAPNTVIEGAWALWLARRSNHRDVSFGLSVAGRDGAVPGIDRMIGLAINNLPVRVRVDDSATVGAWLRGLHEAQSEVQLYAYTPLDRVQEWSGLPWRTRLFETLLVFQHDSADAATRAWLGEDIAIEPVHVPTRTAYPLAVMVAGGDAIELRVTFDPRYFDAASANEMARGLKAALLAVVGAPNQSLGDVLGALPQPSVVSTAARDDEYVAPRNATEAVLAGLWSEVLGIDRLGVRDDFFALGGYSLVATQIVSRVRDTLHVELPVRLLFQHPSVARLADALKAREKKPGQVERVAQLVQRVNAMSLDELKRARAARAGVT